MQYYKANNPSDMAKLLPGFYWLKGWRYPEDKQVVCVCLHHVTNKRMISDGCEYTVEELVQSAGSDRVFYGPLEEPSFETS